VETEPCLSRATFQEPGFRGDSRTSWRPWLVPRLCLGTGIFRILAGDLIHIAMMWRQSQQVRHSQAEPGNEKSRMSTASAASEARVRPNSGTRTGAPLLKDVAGPHVFGSFDLIMISTG